MLSFVRANIYLHFVYRQHTDKSGKYKIIRHEYYATNKFRIGVQCYQFRHTHSTDSQTHTHEAQSSSNSNFADVRACLNVPFRLNSKHVIRMHTRNRLNACMEHLFCYSTRTWRSINYLCRRIIFRLLYRSAPHRQTPSRYANSFSSSLLCCERSL